MNKLIQNIRRLSDKQATILTAELLSNFGGCAARNIEGIRKGNPRFVGLGAGEPVVSNYIEGWLNLLEART